MREYYLHVKLFLTADFLKNRKARFEYFSLDPHHIAARGLA